VENLAGYVRRNFLVPLPASQDYGELNAYLLDCCGQDAPAPVHRPDGVRVMAGGAGQVVTIAAAAAGSLQNLYSPVQIRMPPPRFMRNY
jgi:hypothetical protein